MNYIVTPIFDHTHPKITEVTFNLPEFVSASKKSVYFVYSFLKYGQLESNDKNGHNHFWQCPPQKKINSHEFASTCKISDYFICSGDTADIKMMQSDWLTAFWPISQKPDFYQLWDLCSNAANSINFH